MLNELQTEVIYVAWAMRAYGGSFVKSLGEALDHADDINAQKIKNAFPDYWTEYKDMGICNKPKDGDF